MVGGQREKNVSRGVCHLIFGDELSLGFRIHWEYFPPSQAAPPPPPRHGIQTMTAQICLMTFNSLHAVHQTVRVPTFV